MSTAAFDATDSAALERFFEDLPTTIDHVMVTAGAPHYGRISTWTWQNCAGDSSSISCSHRRSPGSPPGRCDPEARCSSWAAPAAVASASAWDSSRRSPPPCPLTANLALELAPVRVNLIAAGFVDTPLSASLLGDGLEARREQLRATLPIRRVVAPADVAALAVHIMTNTALTGATYDIDGGQQLVAPVST